MTKDEFQKAVDDVITNCIRNDYSFGSYACKVTDAVWPVLEAAEKERDALRAKITEMEKQEPIGWVTEDYQADKSATTYNYEIAKRWRNKGWPVSNLYALPGAKGEKDV